MPCCCLLLVLLSESFGSSAESVGGLAAYWVGVSRMPYIVNGHHKGPGVIHPHFSHGLLVIYATGYPLVRPTPALIRPTDSGDAALIIYFDAIRTRRISRTPT